MGAFVLLSESPSDPGNLEVWKLSWLRQSKQEPWNSWEQSHVYLCLLWIWECQTPLLPKKQIQTELVEKAFPPLGGEQVKICVWRVLQKHLVPGKARISPGKLSLPA